MRIKICGITRPQDGVAAAEAGVDAIGLVFASSPRRVTQAKAREIIREVPPFVSVVGVFVDTPAATILRLSNLLNLDYVQLHGEEDVRMIRALRSLRIIKALRVRDRTFVDQIRRYADIGVCAILLDAFSPKARGGSGERFDWSLVADARRAGALKNAPPIILAGGLSATNVREAIGRVRPWAVDVSSGAESSPGVKSVRKIERFIAAVRSA